jgi:hypothetical protein
MIMGKSWFSSLTSSYGLPPEKPSATAPTEARNNEEESWSSPLSTGHGRLHHKTICDSIS